MLFSLYSVHLLVVGAFVLNHLYKTLCFVFFFFQKKPNPLRVIQIWIIKI
jgi:hypothetical protein